MNHKFPRRKIFYLLLTLTVLIGCQPPAATPNPLLVTGVTSTATPAGETIPATEPTPTPTAIPPTPTSTVVIPTAVTAYQDGDFWNLPEGDLAPTDYGEALRRAFHSGFVPFGIRQRIASVLPSVSCKKAIHKSCSPMLATKLGSSTNVAPRSLSVLCAVEIFST